MKIAFTDRELDVMAVLWAGSSARGPKFVSVWRNKLAHTTELEEKGYVGHTGEGRAYRYRPLVKRAAAGRTALRGLLDKMFQGSPALLLTQLASDRSLDKQELRRLRRVLDERFREENP